MRIFIVGTVSHTVLPDGTKLVLYPNGNRKEIWPDGRGTQVIYYNGDIKQKLADGSVIYTYADSGTKHTTKPDGTDILEFSRLFILFLKSKMFSINSHKIIVGRLRLPILMVDPKSSILVER